MNSGQATAWDATRNTESMGMGNCNSVVLNFNHFHTFTFAFVHEYVGCFNLSKAMFCFHVLACSNFWGLNKWIGEHNTSRGEHEVLFGLGILYQNFTTHWYLRLMGVLSTVPLEALVMYIGGIFLLLVPGRTKTPFSYARVVNMSSSSSTRLRQIAVHWLRWATQNARTMFSFNPGISQGLPWQGFHYGFDYASHTWYLMLLTPRHIVQQINTAKETRRDWTSTALHL